jgi:hypothetical protein
MPDAPCNSYQTPVGDADENTCRCDACRVRRYRSAGDGRGVHVWATGTSWRARHLGSCRSLARGNPRRWSGALPTSQFFDHETGRLGTTDNSLAAKVLPMCPAGINRYPCLRNRQAISGAGSRNRTHDQRFTKPPEDFVISLHHHLLTASAQLHRSSRRQRNARAGKLALLCFGLQTLSILIGRSSQRLDTSNS